MRWLNGQFLIDENWLYCSHGWLKCMLCSPHSDVCVKVTTLYTIIL
uniref:Uncharacterized protein n=1 Tax=Anguilla anguilla TaxID=7936 RepID=A0A0E9RPW8_ANGAN